MQPQPAAEHFHVLRWVGNLIAEHDVIIRPETVWERLRGEGIDASYDGVLISLVDLSEGPAGLLDLSFTLECLRCGEELHRTFRSVAEVKAAVANGVVCNACRQHIIPELDDFTPRFRVRDGASDAFPSGLKKKSTA